MCAPYLPQVLAATSMITNYANIQSQNTQASLDYNASKEQSYLDRQALDKQAEELRKSYGLEMFERDRQTAREQGLLTTAAGEAGVGGNTPLRELANSIMQGTYDKAIQHTNLENDLGMIQSQREGIAIRDRTAEQNYSFNQVNPFMAILQVATGAAGAWKQGEYSLMQDPLPSLPPSTTPNNVSSDTMNRIYNQGFNPYNTLTQGGNNLGIIDPLDFYGSLQRRGGMMRG